MSLLCKLGFHGKIEDRVICEGSSGIRLLAAHCSRCGHCYVLLDEMTKLMIRQMDVRAQSAARGNGE